VSHPYLNAFSSGELPDIEFAVRDFAYQYGLYNVQFVRYLTNVIDNLSKEEHKQILQSNLEEETGRVHDVDLPAEVLASIDKLPHVELYRRFQRAVGVDLEFNTANQDSQPGMLWSEQFSLLCERNEYVGVGALGIGTELIVSKIYHQILKGLKAHTNLTINQRVFFDLHSECDDDHAAQLNSIAEDLATDSDARQQIEYGVTQALSLRVEFWDRMLDRALNYSNHNAFVPLKAI